MEGEKDDCNCIELIVDTVVDGDSTFPENDIENDIENDSKVIKLALLAKKMSLITNTTQKYLGWLDKCPPESELLTDATPDEKNLGRYFNLLMCIYI